VAELPPGYKDVPEEDRKKAKAFFDYGRTRAATSQFEYAIEMYLSGLKLDPESIEAHQELRDVSLKRKASGGKKLGIMEVLKSKRPSKDDKENMLNAEKLLAYDPGEASYMIQIAQNAYRAGYFDTVLWAGAICLRANADSGKPDFGIFLALRDLYKGLERWKLAADACQFALRLRPNDMELQTELKNYGALDTIRGSGYEKAGSFRDQVKDMKGQLRLLDTDKEVSDTDVMTRLIADARKDVQAEPNEPGKMVKLVDLLVKTEKTELENEAIELLKAWFDKTKQYRFRQRVGQIQMKQWAREDKAKRAALDKPIDANDEEAKQAKEAERQEYKAFREQLLQFELSEFKQWSEAYPTDMSLQYEMGRRHFLLGQFDEAISAFQTARNDPKFRTDAAILLGRSFLEHGFLDEADDTLTVLARDYPQRDGPKFKDMCYWRGRVLEQKNEPLEAINAYRQVFMLDSSYLDVAARIKRLRPPAAEP